MNGQSEIIGLTEAARLIGCDEYYAARLADRGLLRAIPGREPLDFDRREVEAFAEERRRSWNQMLVIYETGDELRYIEDTYG